tara:strand:+ start:155 stop:676 length:522 start_codon:yes stop_codon:yes gene_type:complete
MICDRTAQIDIRKLAKLVDVIPEVFDLHGERIVTAWTTTNFGGQRQWFLCPSCDRRCAIIYRRGSGPLWCCRVCGGGRYLTELKSPKERKLHKALKIRRRLGQKNPGLLLPFPGKPRHMHTETYRCIRQGALAREGEILVQDLAELRGVDFDEMRAEFETNRSHRLSGADSDI